MMTKEFKVIRKEFETNYRVILIEKITLDDLTLEITKLHYLVSKTSKRVERRYGSLNEVFCKYKVIKRD